MPGTFNCSLTTPESEVFNREVTYVDLPACDGQMGIQVNRAPALVKLGYGMLRLLDSAGVETKMMVGGGFAQMKGDQLAILTDEARELGDITEAEADKAMAEAEAMPGSTPTEAASKQRQTDRARAMKKLSQV